MSLLRASSNLLIHAKNIGRYNNVIATCTALESPFSLKSQTRNIHITRTLFRENFNDLYPEDFQTPLPYNWGVRVVPQQQAWVIERFGKFSQVLKPGLHFMIPVVDRIAYVHSLKEEAVKIPGQSAITRDNVTIHIDGVLYIKIINPYDASYGVENALYAVTQLAQTTMRSELGKITLDKTFEERESLNANIVASINQAASNWGIQCLRYEIRDITPPVSVKTAMDMQAEAERRKRAEILDSEGARQAYINVAEGKKEAIILEAHGQANAILAKAKATSFGIRHLAEAIKINGGQDAVSLTVAEQYIKAFGNVAQKGTTVLLPANTNDPSNMIASALTIFNRLQHTQPSVDATIDKKDEIPELDGNEMDTTSIDDKVQVPFKFDTTTNDPKNGK